MRNKICWIDKTHVTRLSKTGTPKWYKYFSSWFCHNCYQRLLIAPRHNHINNPRFNKIWNPINNPKQLKYKKKPLILEERILTGKCDWCGKKIGEEYINYKGEKAIIKRTSIHHIEYHDDDPLKDTVELCNSCHSKETWRLKKKK